MHIIDLYSLKHCLQAARDGKEFIVREWLDNTPQGMKGAIINVKDPHGYAALHYAARFNRFKIMQLLVTARGIGQLLLVTMCMHDSDSSSVYSVDQ